MREEDAILFRLAEEVLDEAAKASLTQSFAQEESQSSDGMVARYELWLLRQRQEEAGPAIEDA